MTTFQDAFTKTYVERRSVAHARKKRTPVLVVLGTLLATLSVFVVRMVVKFKRNLMYIAGFGFIDFALFGWNPLVGYAAIGVTLLLLEMLSGGDET